MAGILQQQALLLRRHQKEYSTMRSQEIHLLRQLQGLLRRGQLMEGLLLQQAPRWCSSLLERLSLQPTRATSQREQSPHQQPADLHAAWLSRLRPQQETFHLQQQQDLEGQAS